MITFLSFLPIIITAIFLGFVAIVVLSDDESDKRT